MEDSKYWCKNVIPLLTQPLQMSGEMVALERRKLTRGLKYSDLSERRHSVTWTSTRFSRKVVVYERWSHWEVPPRPQGFPFLIGWAIKKGKAQGPR